MEKVDKISIRVNFCFSCLKMEFDNFEAESYEKETLRFRYFIVNGYEHECLSHIASS